MQYRLVAEIAPARLIKRRRPLRDVADLPMRAMSDPAANGERFLAVAGDFVMARDLANVLRAYMGEAGKRVPTRAIPDWLLRMSALFDPEVRQVRNSAN